MHWRRATVVLLVLLVAGVLAYDLAALLGGGPDATVSRVVYESARRWPVIPFLAGVVCGHFFWPVKGGA